MDLVHGLVHMMETAGDKICGDAYMRPDFPPVVAGRPEMVTFYFEERE
jgi:hypothetical protein